MQKSKFLALLGILAVFMTLVACPPPAETSEDDTQNQGTTTEPTTTTIHSQIADYYGSWISTNSRSPYDDWFDLSTDKTFIYYNNGDPTNDIGYKGEVICTDLSGDYLFLNIKNTSKESWGLEANTYTRIALQKNGEEVKMSTGTVGIWPNSSNNAATLEDLLKDFTFENGAFAGSGDYIEKPESVSANTIIVGKKWEDNYLSWNSYTVNDVSYDCQIGVNFIETACYGRQEGRIYQVKINETSGYIYYRITDTTSFTYSQKDPSYYMNKWYAMYYKDLTENSVTMCDASPGFETPDPNTHKIADYHCADSLGKAVTTFTVANRYFESEIPFTIVTQ